MFENQRLLITGSTSGIGLATAVAFADAAGNRTGDWSAARAIIQVLREAGARSRAGECISTLERDGFSSNRHLALSFCLSTTLSEGRRLLFRIML